MPTNAREYVTVYSLMLGMGTMVILSSDKAVKDLMDKKCGKYSHRPEMYVGQELCSGSLRVLMMVCSLSSENRRRKSTNTSSSHTARGGEA